MIDFKELQEKVFANKVAKGFNITDVPLELCLIQGELAELFEAWIQRKPDAGEVGDELADIVIYLLGLAEILGVDLEKELLKKIGRNEERKYVRKGGAVVRTREA